MPDDWDNDEPIQVRQFKCLECGCINVFFPDDPECIQVMEHGWGLHTSGFSVCTRWREKCMCHTGVGKDAKIISRLTTLQDLAKEMVHA